MPKPNLFDYATSELSQDAFICWLLAWNKKKYPGRKESQVAKEFIAYLYNLFMDLAESKKDSTLWGNDFSRVAYSDVGDFLDEDKMPIRQKVFKIDVFFVIQIKGKNVAFIIEDKTNTSPHSNQLARYVYSVSNDKKYKEMPIIRIFYKTGYIYPEDEKACNNNKCIIVINKKEHLVNSIYCILNAAAIYHSFLEKYKLEYDVYQDYMDFIKKTYVLPQKDARECFDDNNLVKFNSKDLRKADVQYEFMKILASKFNDEQPVISRGRSVGGKSWTHYDFRTLKKIYGEKNERLFWRVEKLSKGYALTLRQYANLSKNNEFRDEKKKRLSKYKSEFKKVSEKTSLKFTRARNDRKCADLSQIALLYIGSKEESNSIQNIFDQLPSLHNAFKVKIDGL